MIHYFKLFYIQLKGIIFFGIKYNLSDKNPLTAEVAIPSTREDANPVPIDIGSYRDVKS